MTTPPESTPHTPPPARRRTWVWVAAGAAAVVAIAVTVVLLLMPNDEPAPDLARSAETACTEYVTSRLKSPATAKFVGIKVEQDGDRYYLVTGEVDSQNSFGALVRSEFECYMAHKDDGEWRAIRAKVE